MHVVQQAKEGIRGQEEALPDWNDEKGGCSKKQAKYRIPEALDVAQVEEAEGVEGLIAMVCIPDIVEVDSETYQS